MTYLTSAVQAAIKNDPAVRTTSKDTVEKVVTEMAATEASVLAAVGARAVKAAIAFDGGASQAIATIPAGSMLVGALLVVTEAFDGTCTIDIGDAGTADGILPDASITKSLAAVNGENSDELGAYLWDTDHSLVKYYAAATAILCALTTDGSTGTADVFLFYIELP